MHKQAQNSNQLDHLCALLRAATRFAMNVTNVTAVTLLLLVLVLVLSRMSKRRAACRCGAWRCALGRMHLARDSEHHAGCVPVPATT